MVVGTPVFPSLSPVAVVSLEGVEEAISFKIPLSPKFPPHPFKYLRFQ